MINVVIKQKVWQMTNNKVLWIKYYSGQLLAGI